MPAVWTLEQLAQTSGEHADRLAWFADAGLLRLRDDGKFEPDALYRVRLIQFARSRGVRDDDLAAAARDQGDLLAILSDLQLSDETSYDLAEAARLAGVDADLLAQLTELIGWDDLEPATAQDVDALRMVNRALSGGLPRDALLQLIRVLTDLSDRMADAETRIFHDYVHEQFRAQGLSGKELLTATDRVSQPLMDLVEPAVLYFHRRAWRRAAREDLLRHLAEAVTPPATTLGEQTVTVMFIDLASFTPLTLAMGDQGAASVLQQFAQMVRRCAAKTNGRIIKQIGDAFMLIFTQPSAAVGFGLTINEQAAEDPAFPALHIGAHCGPVLFREGDYVGGTVNLAARVASAGGPGEFFVTPAVRDATTTAVDARFVEHPPRLLKGLTEPVALVEVLMTTM